MRTITSGKTRISAIDRPEPALSNINMHNVTCMGTQTSNGPYFLFCAPYLLLCLLYLFMNCLPPFNLGYVATVHKAGPSYLFMLMMNAARIPYIDGKMD